MNYANFIGVFYGLFLVVQRALAIGVDTLNYFWAVFLLAL